MNDVLFANYNVVCKNCLKNWNKTLKNVWDGIFCTEKVAWDGKNGFNWWIIERF